MGEGNIMKAFRLVLSQESGFGLLLIFKSIVKHKLLWAVPSRAQNTIFSLLLLILLLRVFLTSDDLHKSTDHNFSNLCFMVRILQEPLFFLFWSWSSISLLRYLSVSGDFVEFQAIWICETWHTKTVVVWWLVSNASAILQPVQTDSSSASGGSLSVVPNPSNF